MDIDKIKIYKLPGCEFSLLIEKLYAEQCNIKVFDPMGYRMFSVKDNATLKEAAKLITNVYNNCEMTKASKIKTAVKEVRKHI